MEWYYWFLLYSIVGFIIPTISIYRNGATIGDLLFCYIIVLPFWPIVTFIYAMENGYFKVEVIKDATSRRTAKLQKRGSERTWSGPF